MFISEAQLKNMNILIVDDDLLFIEPARKFIEEKGRELFTAADSDLAIQTLRENPSIRLVIVDYDVRHRKASNFVAGVRKATGGKKIWVVRNDSLPRSDFTMEQWMMVQRVEKYANKTEALNDLRSYLAS